MSLQEFEKYLMSLLAETKHHVIPAMKFEFFTSTWQFLNQINHKKIKSNEMLVLGERGKPEYLEKNLLEQSRGPANSTHLSCRVGESNPGYIGERSHHCTIPALLCNLKGRLPPPVIRCEPLLGLHVRMEMLLLPSGPHYPRCWFYCIAEKNSLFVLKCSLCNFEASILSLSRQTSVAWFLFFVLTMLCFIYTENQT